MKKKILALCLVVVLAVTAITGVTLAYFTDTEVVNNTFTTGGIDLTLDEARVKVDTNGDYVEDTSKERTEEGVEYDLHPGQSVWKDPKMTLTTTGSDKAYLAAMVVIDADLSELWNEKGEFVDFRSFVSGGVTYPAGYTMEMLTDLTDYDDLPVKDGFKFAFHAWDVTIPGGNNYYLTQLVKYHTENVKKLDAEGNDPVLDNEGKPEMEEVTVIDDVTMCYYFKNKKDNGDAVTLFNTLKIDEDWNNAEMAKLNDMKIDVTGYAAQVDGFTDVLDAMSKTFASALSVK